MYFNHRKAQKSTEKHRKKKYLTTDLTDKADLIVLKFKSTVQQLTISTLYPWRLSVSA